MELFKCLYYYISCLILALLLIPFLIFHFVLISKGKTTLESFEKKEEEIVLLIFFYLILFFVFRKIQILTNMNIDVNKYYFLFKIPILVPLC